MNKIVKTEDQFITSARVILNKAYARRLVPEDDGGYSASIQEFPGCFSEGDTAEEALDRLNDAAESWVATQLAHGNAVRDPIAFHGVSGKIALRIPRGLHQQVAELAEMEDCSINQLLTAAIAEYVGRTNTIHRIGEMLHHSHLATMNIVQVKDWEVVGAPFVHAKKVISNEEVDPFFALNLVSFPQLNTLINRT